MTLTPARRAALALAAIPAVAAWPLGMLMDRPLLAYAGGRVVLAALVLLLVASVAVWIVAERRRG